jgi:mutual gliding-motility protein MglA
MALCNYAEMTLTAKIVYYGPGLGGKTTNLNHIHKNTLRDARGEMVSLNTDTERTLFFDLLPIAAGALGGFKAQIQLYTVPGQVFYNAMRKIVLNGADGIVFVADSQRSVSEVNRQSFDNLKANLKEAGLGLGEVPLVLQYNKRDLPEVLSVDELNQLLNPERQFEWFEACAAQGRGVFETLEGISKLTFRAVRERFVGEGKLVAEDGAEALAGVQAPPAVAPPAAPAPGAAEPPAAAKAHRHRHGRKRGGGPKGPPGPEAMEPEADALPVLAVPSALPLPLEPPAPAADAASQPPDPKPASPEPAPPAMAAETQAGVGIEAVAAGLAEPPPAPVPAADGGGEAALEEDWEISFGDDQAGRRRRDLNLMAELEKLRIHVGGSPTSPRPDSADRKPKGEPAAALDQLVAATLGGRSRPGSERPGERPPAVPGIERGPAPGVFRFEVNLPEADRSRLRRLVLSLRPEGSAREPLGPSHEYVVDLENARDAETLLLSLKVQLKGPRS